jgi:hypothetical protein
MFGRRGRLPAAVGGAVVLAPKGPEAVTLLARRVANKNIALT